MSEAHGVRQRAAARDALAARTRVLTSAALAISAVLSGLFAGSAAASAPGHKLVHGALTRGAKGRQTTTTVHVHASTAIPPLPAAPGPGNDAAAPPPAPAPAPAPAPSATQSPPAVVSGGS